MARGHDACNSHAIHDVAPVAREALEKIAAKVMSVPKDLAARAKPFLE